MDMTKTIKDRGEMRPHKWQRPYELAFREHLRSFILTHKLIDPQIKTIVSISGGVDSIVLAHALHKLNFNIELLHFNHGTRPEENVIEENFIKEFAKEINSKIEVRYFKMDLADSNFENISRVMRKKVHQEFVKENYQVVTAHHIDDSFEWGLMQSFKQSGVVSSLGIPVMSAGIVRPFMCVTKAHIKKYARAVGLKWMEDSSNEDSKFERNYLRLNISSVIQKRYPNALKHYVSRSNQEAFMHNVHRLGRVSELKMQAEDSGGVLFVSESFKEHKSILKKTIHQFSNKTRGEVDGELDKFIKAQEFIKNNQGSFPFKGPMTFSGGALLFLIKNSVLVTNLAQLEFYRRLDQEITSYLKNISQIPGRAMMTSFPGLVIGFGKKLKKPSKFIHPLLPGTCEWLKNSGISYTFTPLMSVEDRQMLAFDAVILDSSVMGL